MEFIRFPHTPHLLWLGSQPPRADKVMSESDAVEFLNGPIVVEEKVDGANVGISFTETGATQLQNRGKILRLAESHEQFRPLFRWVDSRLPQLKAKLTSRLVLFGEWSYATHTIRYTSLPDWFLAFDVFDRAEGCFWNASRRNELFDELQLATVPKLAEGKFTVDSIARFLGPSRLGASVAEGIYLRKDGARCLGSRAKIVRPEFQQSIEEHWAKRALETNLLSSGVSW